MRKKQKPDDLDGPVNIRISASLHYEASSYHRLEYVATFDHIPPV